MRDAHSWVEANIDGAWSTFDPSPRGAAPPAPISALTLYIDGLRMRWYRYVVGWSQQDQLQAAGAVRRLAWSWPMAPRMSGADAPRQTLAVALLGAVVVGAIVWGVRYARGGRRARAAAMPDFYAKALARLARRGLRPAPSETAREFCARVGADAPPLVGPFSRLTTAYESARFGRQSCTPAEAQELREVATRPGLRAWAGASRTPHVRHRREATGRDPCPAPRRARATWESRSHRSGGRSDSSRYPWPGLRTRRRRRRLP